MDLGTIIAHVFLFISLYFEVFLLATFIEKKAVVDKETPEPTYFPSVTVIVPCFNEAKTIVATIQSLLALDYPSDKLSICIVNDGSTDESADVLTQFESNPRISIFHKENGGKYTALNFALSKITTDLVGCLDADSFVDSQALKRIVVRFEDKSVMAVTPAIVVHNPKNFIEMIQKAEYTLSIFIRRVFAFAESVYITPGPFSFFRREVFNMIGIYRHAHNTEDLEIALRMQKHNLKIDNAHDAFVYTTAPKTFRKLFKQRLRWTHGFLENAIDYRSMYFKPRYGNLSMFILPIATLSIFSALYFTGYALLSMVTMVSDRVVEYSAIGLNLPNKLPHFDIFYVRTESVFILSMILVFVTLLLMLSGKYISEKRVSFSRDMLYFILFYSFLAPFWLARSVYNTALSKKTSWR